MCHNLTSCKRPVLAETAKDCVNVFLRSPLSFTNMWNIWIKQDCKETSQKHTDYLSCIIIIFVHALFHSQLLKATAHLLSAACSDLIFTRGYVPSNFSKPFPQMISWLEPGGLLQIFAKGEMKFNQNWGMGEIAGGTWKCIFFFKNRSSGSGVRKRFEMVGPRS